jgi:hypothetical protein
MYVSMYVCMYVCMYVKTYVFFWHILLYLFLYAYMHVCAHSSDSDDDYTLVINSNSPFEGPLSLSLSLSLSLQNSSLDGLLRCVFIINLNMLFDSVLPPTDTCVCIFSFCDIYLLFLSFSRAPPGHPQIYSRCQRQSNAACAR